MAAIGFQLRRLLRLNSITGELAAYTYAGLAGSGPLLVSILGIFLIGLVGLQHIDTPELVMQFQVSITYLMAASLIITGPVQLVLSRSIAMAGEGIQRGCLRRITSPPV